ncbi:MAG: hypothetical protein ACE5OY_09060, partial [Candidatus Bathyarchaeia archaeon]
MESRDIYGLPVSALGDEKNQTQNVANVANIHPKPIVLAFKEFLVLRIQITTQRSTIRMALSIQL